MTFSRQAGNAIVVDSHDPYDRPLVVSLTASSGLLTLGSRAGISFVAGDGVDDRTITLRGSESAVNAALEGLRYAVTSTYGTVEIRVTDGENNASVASIDVAQVPLVSFAATQSPVASPLVVTTVEVRSESDYGPTAERDIADKRADYFAAGTLAVWDVDPITKTVTLYLPGSPTQALTFGLGATILTRAGTRQKGEAAAAARQSDEYAWQTPTPVSGDVAARRPVASVKDK